MNEEALASPLVTNFAPNFARMPRMLQATRACSVPARCLTHLEESFKRCPGFTTSG
jgi:hypothetical protein